MARQGREGEGERERGEGERRMRETMTEKEEGEEGRETITYASMAPFPAKSRNPIIHS